MSDNISDTSHPPRTAPSPRAVLLDELADLAARIGADRDAHLDARLVSDADRAHGEQLLASVRDGDVLHRQEAARFEVVTVEMLDGGETRYAAERVRLASVYDAWVGAMVADPRDEPLAWTEQLAPAGHFPDLPHLPQLAEDGIDYLPLSRKELRTTVEELYDHVRTDPDEYGVTAWEMEFAELVGATVHTLRHGEVLTAGETARAERIASTLSDFRTIDVPEGHTVWELVENPDLYHPWAQAEAQAESWTALQAAAHAVDIAPARTEPDWEALRNQLAEHDERQERLRPSVPGRTGGTDREITRPMQAPEPDEAENSEIASRIDDLETKLVNLQWQVLRHAVNASLGHPVQTVQIDAEELRAQQTAAIAGRARPPSAAVTSKPAGMSSTSSLGRGVGRVTRRAHGVGW